MPAVVRLAAGVHVVSWIDGNRCPGDALVVEVGVAAARWLDVADIVVAAPWAVIPAVLSYVESLGRLAGT
jgi:hypothetical protein